MTFRCLCQDCLRAPTYATYAAQMDAHQERVLCECGGQLCACDSCLLTLSHLEAGERGTLEGTLQISVGAWSASDGAISATNTVKYLADVTSA